MVLSNHLSEYAKPVLTKDLHSQLISKERRNMMSSHNSPQRSPDIHAHTNQK